MSSDDRKKEPGQQGDETPAEETVQENTGDPSSSSSSVPDSGAPDTAAAGSEPVKEAEDATVAPVTEAEAEAEPANAEATASTDAEAPTIEPEPEEKTAPPASPAGAPVRSDGFARFVAVIALLVAAGGVALSQFPQVPQGSAARLADLSERVAEVENAAPAQPAGDNSAELQALNDRLAAADERLNNLSLLVDEIRTVQATAAANPPASDTGGGSAADEPAVTMDQFAELTGRVQDLARRVEAQEQAPAPATAETPAAATDSEAILADVASVKSELDALREELARLEEAQSGLSGRVTEDVASVRSELSAELDDRAGQLAKRIDDVATTAQQSLDAGNSRVASRAALVLAAGRLRDAANSGEPFAGAWNAVTALGVPASDYEAIASNAANGVATLTSLQNRFSEAAARAIVADQVGDGESWMDGALRRVGSLVSVRRTGDLEGDSVEAMLARAEQKLQGNDLTAALAELGGLDAAPAKAMQDWLADARRRSALDQAIDALQSSLLDAPDKQG